MIPSLSPARSGGRRARRWRRLAAGLVSLAALTLGTVLLPLPARAEGPAGAPAEQLLVGILLGTREVDAFEVLRENGSFLLPLEPFLSVVGCRLDEEAPTLRIVTPLGEVEPSPADLLRSGGVSYLRESFVEGALATKVTFESGRYALRLDPPWRVGAARAASPSSAPAPAAEVRPPKASLSTARLDLRYTRLEESDTLGGYTVLGGRLAGGWWRTRYERRSGGVDYLREYAWMHTQRRTLELVGHQWVNLHPLLNTVELTGAQVAWTNQPLSIFARPVNPRELLPRRLRSMTTITGPGPPGSIAELRVNDRIVSRRTIGFDGVYEFLDVSLPARQLSHVEVRLYDRYDLSIPFEIQEQEQSGAEYLLPRGAMVHQGALGAEGNLLQDLREDRPREGGAGFYQFRYGATGDLTFEAVYQEAGDRRQVLGGLTSRLGRRSILGLGLAESNGSMAYDFALENRWDRWRLMALSQVKQDGFLSPVADRSYDHFVEAGYRPDPRLDVSLIGRSRRYGSSESEYLLPAVGWMPRPWLSVRARPNLDGDYRYDLYWRARPTLRFALSGERHHAYVDMTWSFKPRWDLVVGNEFTESGSTRQRAFVTSQGQGRWLPSWTAGLLYANGDPGYLLGARMVPVPGLFLGMHYESDSLINSPDAPPQSRFFLSLTTDLVFARGRVLPAYTVSVRDDRGAIGGAVKVNGLAPGGGYDLSDLTILVDGRPRATTTPSGGFLVSGLKAGIYQVGLDAERLPIELNPERASVTVEVAGGAVTRTDFSVQVAYGLAGRVTTHGGKRLVGVVVDLVDELGRTVTSAETDRFGLYRMDEVPPGRYKLRLSTGDLPPEVVNPPTLLVEVTDDFLFDQNLTLP